MTASADAVEIVKSMQPNPDNWKHRHRGFVDWKFGELAAYRGYSAAVDYAETMRRWHDFDTRYQDCLLNTTYSAFLEAEQQHTSTCQR